MVKISPEVQAERLQRSYVHHTFMQSVGKNDYGPDIDWSKSRLVPNDQRACFSLLRDLRARGKGTSAVLDYADRMLASPSPTERKMGGRLRLAIVKEQASTSFKSNDFVTAIAQYQAAMRVVLGADSVLPSRKFYDEHYVRGFTQDTELSSASNLDAEELLDLLLLASNIAQCFLKLEKTVEAIDWLQECEQILLCHRAVTIMREPQPEWKLYFMCVVEYWIVRRKTWVRNVHQFTATGNTALAAIYAKHVVVDVGILDDGALQVPRLRAMQMEFDPFTFFAHRHPEPNLSVRTVTCPEIQVLGVWDRQRLASGSTKPCGRMWASTWIWRGSLYVVGGTTDKREGSQVVLNDLWCLDLESRGWRRLADVPVSGLSRRTDATNVMCVWNDRAYYFAGTLRLAVFDLVQEEWHVVTTSLPRGASWPYHGGAVFECSAKALLDGVLYIFGGRDGAVPLGHNIFMALDLATYRWRHISGTSAHNPQLFEPNLRVHAAMWADPAQRKVYVLYGMALRQAACLQRAPGGSETDHTYNDFWSFHVDKHKWERERLRGNFPAPRAESAHIYSPALQRAVVYGGYHGSLMTRDDQVEDMLNPNAFFRYSYFGDTLLYDPETRLWQLVLVKGFPSYRAAGSFACDPESGKLYLFGGYSNAEFCPSKNQQVRTYNDLWQLKIDMPGGNWKPKDLERDIRMERMGPWSRCFTCGVCDISWQKCGGTCGGKYYFCSKDCQKNGWKEHKEKHGCRKQ